MKCLERQPGVSLILLSAYCIALTLAAPPESAIGKNDTEAIDKLFKVFGVENKNKNFKFPVRQRSPPQYMIDLFQAVAEPDSGIVKGNNPYFANVIRGLPDRASYHQLHYVFNVSTVRNTEQILEVEFHIFKLKPKLFHSKTHMKEHLIELRLHQVLRPTDDFPPDSLKLLEIRRTSLYSSGWEVFKIKNAFLTWTNDSLTNHGLLLSAYSLAGTPVNDTIRFAQRGQHHDTKQPVVVVFTDDGRPRFTATTEPYAESHYEEYTVLEPVNYRWVPRGPNRAALFLNERPEEFIQKGQQQQQQPQRDQEDQETPPDDQEKGGRKRRRRDVYSYRSSLRNKPTCAVREMYVDFDQIGWSGWIISPKGYQGYHCKGECPFPLGQNQKPTNHATVQSIVHALRVNSEVNMPCCVPIKLKAISLLYFDDDENVILKQYDDMVVESCGCR